MAQSGIDLVHGLPVQRAEAFGVVLLEPDVGLEVPRLEQPFEPLVPLQSHERLEFVSVIQPVPDETADDVAEMQVVEDVGRGVRIEGPGYMGFPVVHDGLQGRPAAAVPGDGAGRLEEVAVQVGHVQPGGQPDRVSARGQGGCESGGDLAVPGRADARVPGRRRAGEAIRDRQGPGLETDVSRQRGAAGIAGGRGHGPQEIHAQAGQRTGELGRMLVPPADEVPDAPERSDVRCAGGAPGVCHGVMAGTGAGA